MNQFIETIKLRLDEAQKRLQIAVQQLQAAQGQHQVAAQEFSSWQNAYAAEMRRDGNPMPGTIVGTAVAVVTVNRAQAQPAQPIQPTQPVQATPVERVEVNKTDLVRDILRQHPAGMTPNDLWKSVSGQITYRPYLYSILKRLKDKGELFQKRGKYCPRILAKSEDGKDQAMLQ